MRLFVGSFASLLIFPLFTFASLKGTRADVILGFVSDRAELASLMSPLPVFVLFSVMPVILATCCWCKGKGKDKRSKDSPKDPSPKSQEAKESDKNKNKTKEPSPKEQIVNPPDAKGNLQSSPKNDTTTSTTQMTESMTSLGKPGTTISLNPKPHEQKGKTAPESTDWLVPKTLKKSGATNDISSTTKSLVSGKKFEGHLTVSTGTGTHEVSKKDKKPLPVEEEEFENKALGTVSLEKIGPVVVLPREMENSEDTFHGLRTMPEV